jgi:prolactin regulatory element-binding protein
LVVATTVNLLVYSLSGSKKGKEKESSVLKLENPSIIERPKLPGGETGTFRVVKWGLCSSVLASISSESRYHPLNPHIFYTVLNTTPARGAKSTKRTAYLVRWNADEWKVERIRKVGVKGLTTFDLRYGFTPDFPLAVLDESYLATTENGLLMARRTARSGC